MHKWYNYTKIKKGEPNLEKLKNCLDKWGHYKYGAENTIDTIIFTGTNGADYVEMDVLLTKDNVPVVIHDNNLKRLGNISKNISDLTLEKEGILEETIFQSSEENIISEFNGKYEELSIGYVFIGKLGAFSARKMSKMPIDFISAE